MSKYKYHKPFMPEDWNRHEPSDRVLDFLDRAVPNYILRMCNKIVCEIVGHEVIRNDPYPEHDFCAWCQKVIPYGAD